MRVIRAKYSNVFAKDSSMFGSEHDQRPALLTERITSIATHARSPRVSYHVIQITRDCERPD